MVDDIKPSKKQSPEIINVRRERLHKLLEIVSTKAAERAIASSKNQRISVQQFLRHNIKWLVLSVVIVAFSAAGIQVIHYYESLQPDPITASIREEVSYPLYYPRRLPEGFSESPKINPAELNGNVITVEYQYYGRPVVMTIQARPRANLPEPYRLKEVTTRAGKGYVTNVNNRPAGIIEGTKTLIFITSEDKLSPDALAAFMSNLVPAN